VANQTLCNLMVFLWRYRQSDLVTHWDNCLSGHQKFQNLMVTSSQVMTNLTDDSHDDNRSLGDLGQSGRGVE
jgi:hypothetical protein